MMNPKMAKEVQLDAAYFNYLIEQGSWVSSNGDQLDDSSVGSPVDMDWKRKMMIGDAPISHELSQAT